MRTTRLWHLFFGLFVNTHCLPDWNTDTQPGELAGSDSLLGNAIENPSIALGTPNGINDGANALSPEMTRADDISDCAPDSKRLPSKKKARRDNICPADSLQFKNGENGRQIPPIAPSGQQGGNGANSGDNGGDNGGGKPQVPFLRFPASDDSVQYIFIPEKIRPREIEEVCPYIDHHVPVCAREADAYISGLEAPANLILDPCHLYEPLMGCLFMEGEIGYCCLMTTVAYSDLNQDQLDSWQSLLTSHPNIGMILGNIERELQHGLPNPFKLVGVDCIPLLKGQGETKTPEGLN